MPYPQCSLNVTTQGHQMTLDELIEFAVTVTPPAVAAMTTDEHSDLAPMVAWSCVRGSGYAHAYMRDAPDADSYDCILGSTFANLLLNADAERVVCISTCWLYHYTDTEVDVDGSLKEVPRPRDHPARREGIVMAALGGDEPSTARVRYCEVIRADIGVMPGAWIDVPDEQGLPLHWMSHVHWALPTEADES